MPRSCDHLTPEKDTPLAVHEGTYTAQAEVRFARQGPASTTFVSTPSLICSFEGREVGRLVFDDLREAGVNVNRLALDDNLPFEAKARIARLLLTTLVAKTGTTAVPRLSFTRAISGPFWSDLERDRLISIDPHVERLP